MSSPQPGTPVIFIERNETKVAIDACDAESISCVAQQAKLEKRLLLKLDTRMLILVVIYILNYIDRSNTTAARLQGFEQDLHLEGQEYSTVLSILYVGYIIMQVPSNLFLNWVGRPSIYLPCCMMVWGIISALTGALYLHSFTGALLARFFIGFVEASFYPGALFLISRWYKRDEVGLRTTLLCCGSLLSSAWGALIASGILGGMQGKLGHAAWRWLFYIEGSLTIFVAICATFILPDFPHNTRWLSPEERQLAISRLEEDVRANVNDPGESVDVSAVKGLWMALTDWKVWWFAGVATLQILAQSLGIFFPTLSATMGFNTTISLVLCAPPWIFTTLVAFVVSRHSDKNRRRFVYIAATDFAGIVGFIIAMCTMNITARYISLFLMAQMYAGLIVFYAWMSNSFPQPPAKRAASIALINALSQLGNVIGAYVWPTVWGPTYRYSMAICLACAVLVISMCWVMSRHLTSLNKRSEKEEHGAHEEGRVVPGFRYLVAARLQGFEQDLHLQGQEYSTVLSILFIGYILMQVPSNLFLNWLGRPSIYLPSCMIVWGVLSILTGITTNFTGALLSRFFIGFVEAAFFPGVLFLISRWYKREEIGLRSAIVTCGSLMSNGWGALIASGILEGMQGKLGHAAWRWLFYVEGSMTIFVAICAIFILPDFPHNTRWLSPEERQLAVSRLREDGTSESDDVTAMKGLWMAVSDWKVWWFAVAATVQLLSQSFCIFFPTLSATMGFNTTISLVLCAPPWIFTTILAFALSRYSDKTRRRFVYIAASESVAILGFIIAICTMNIAARYLSLFFMTQMFAGLIVFYAWMSNSFPQPPAKRAASLALINGLSQLGNVVGSYVWPSGWGPTYRYSFAICMATAALFIGMCWVMSLHLASLNRKMDTEEQAARENGEATSKRRYLV
ncbi:MFS general substrate transporter [Leucogyrophana mollusca]|uniref:MFS general substrate transporter n=1 Tax=Leucogyrophana mollusca TaxID=85980 RepID=A0ACB8BSP6_9AGAM|nr:MFS general substrate transporter [Leucogyrophana mollusca]